MSLRIDVGEDSLEEVERKVSDASNQDYLSLHASSVGKNLQELQDILDILSRHLKTKPLFAVME